MSNHAEDAEHERRSQEHDVVIAQAAALDRIASALERIVQALEAEAPLECIAENTMRIAGCLSLGLNELSKMASAMRARELIKKPK